MVSGQGFARVERISARNKAITDKGGCDCCHPHNGENYSLNGRKDGRWVGNKFVPSKGKNRK